MPGDLARTLSWVQAALLDPAGAGGAEQVFTASAALTAGQRLAIYQRGYRLRLLETMQAHYPALHHLLGGELFDGFALDYLAANPSRSRSLDDLGARYVTHLERTRPDRDARRPEPWIDLLVDVARYERLFLEVHSMPAPCVRFVIAGFPVHQYVQQVRRGADPDVPRPGQVHLVLHQHEYVVTVTELTPVRYQLLADLVRGTPIPEALRGVDASDVSSWLRSWTSQGLIPPSDTPPVHSDTATGVQQ